MPTIETVFNTPGPQPNGMQATEDGLWILDQQTNEVHLVSYDGDVKKTLATGSDKRKRYHGYRRHTLARLHLQLRNPCNRSRNRQNARFL